MQPVGSRDRPSRHPRRPAECLRQLTIVRRIRIILVRMSPAGFPLRASGRDDGCHRVRHEGGVSSSVSIRSEFQISDRSVKCRSSILPATPCNFLHAFGQASVGAEDGRRRPCYGHAASRDESAAVGVPPSACRILSKAGHGVVQSTRRGTSGMALDGSTNFRGHGSAARPAEHHEVDQGCWEAQPVSRHGPRRTPPRPRP